MRYSRDPIDYITILVKTGEKKVGVLTGDIGSI
jgi:hypothetical protein